MYSLANATVKQSSYFGYKDHRIDVNFYKFRMNDSSLIELSVLKDGCVPVTEYVAANGTVGEISYTGVTPGIRDMSVFDVPNSCQKVSPDLHVSQILEFV